MAGRGCSILLAELLLLNTEHRAGSVLPTVDVSNYNCTLSMTALAGSGEDKADCTCHLIVEFESADGRAEPNPSSDDETGSVLLSEAAWPSPLKNVLDQPL